MQAIRRTFFSENVAALRRLVISLSRGCLQVPGLSGIGDTSARVDLTGVAMLNEMIGERRESKMLKIASRLSRDGVGRAVFERGVNRDVGFVNSA